MAKDGEKWPPVVEEAQRAFSSFQENFGNMASGDRRWTITSVIRGQQPKLLIATYNDSPEGASSGVGYKVVKMSASIGLTSTTGLLVLSGDEDWEFAKAAEIGSKVADIITPILQASNLIPTPEGKAKEGRNSHWFNMWKLWPTNHPKFKK